MPQDVHPQQYQAAGVGAPPGVQWGVAGPAPGQGPTPSAPVSDWNRRLAAIDHPQAPPQNIYEQRDGIRPPPPPRQPSPRPEHVSRQDQMRQYQEQHRHTPVRRPSPPPNSSHIPPGSYPTPQGLPQPAPLQAQQPAPTRITNPNYPAPIPAIAPTSNGPHSGQGPIAPDGRGNSPLPYIRPINDDRVSSPSAGYAHQQYQHHPISHSGGIAGGAPPPTAALAAAEAAAARERDERQPVGIKRMIESDEEFKYSNKKPANGDNRSRLEDHHYHRSPPMERPPSPRDRHRRSSSEIRREDQRRANENYHPSEAAHHPPTLPSLHTPQDHHPPMPAEVSRDDRRETYEPAARKMDVDENYDDEVDDEKRLVGSGGRNSPQRGLINGQPKSEPQG